jgi:hypothetical protein
LTGLPHHPNYNLTRKFLLSTKNLNHLPQAGKINNLPCILESKADATEKDLNRKFNSGTSEKVQRLKELKRLHMRGCCRTFPFSWFRKER